MKQRLHRPRHLFWRGVVAAVGNAAMFTGAYPLLPQVGVAIARRRAGRPQPPRQWRALAAEWAVSVAMSAARPVGFLARTAQPTGPRPVILVHGYAMNRANFLVLAQRLRAAGLGPVLGFEYWSLGKISSAARKLDAYVEGVCAAAGTDRVDLIGHSMGGVVGRYLITLGGAADRVRTLITLGSPHGGADLSVFGVGRPVKELKRESELLNRLSAHPLPERTSVTAIWSRADALVPWEGSASLPGAEEIVFDDLGHLTMLTDRRVAEILVERLKR